MSACHISLFILWLSDSISKNQKGGAFFRKPSASKCDLLDTMVYKRRNKCCNKKDKVFLSFLCSCLYSYREHLERPFIPPLYRPSTASCTDRSSRRETSEKVWVGYMGGRPWDCCCRRSWLGFIPVASVFLSDPLGGEQAVHVGKALPSVPQ